ncbi:MAG: ferredoxin-thioredoxin reductase catalytic domain-containing protein [Candidatus ainarchaeum sp.]|nr:ferredoxin-thioredoxin reductase catalytic domain-containing protein [Candidatus ainarchaeum sp.]
MDKTEEKILEDSEKYAKTMGFWLNKDKKMLEIVIAALAKKQEKHGRPYCPCRVFTGKAEEDEKIACPCIFHIEEIKKDGHCKCRLFFGKKS